MPNRIQVVLDFEEGGQIIGVYVNVDYKIESMFMILLKIIVSSCVVCNKHKTLEKIY